MRAQLVNERIPAQFCFGARSPVMLDMALLTECFEIARLIRCATFAEFDTVMHFVRVK